MNVSLRYLTYLLLSLFSTFIFAAACSSTINVNATSLRQPLTDCRIVQHAMGRTCVPNHLDRIVAISQFTLGNAIALGVKPIASASAQNDLRDFPAYLKPYTQGIQQLGNQYEPNLEKVLKIKPDLILGWSIARKVYPLLSQISPTALGAWKGTQSWKEHFNFVAEALGKQDAQQKAWDRYYDRIAELKIALNDRYKGRCCIKRVGEGKLDINQEMKP